MSSLTPEEVAKVRPAFSSNGQLGLFESIVRTGHEKTRNINVDVPLLKETYAKFQCSGVVKLITYLAVDTLGLQEIGSGSIDLAGVTDGEFSLESAMSLQELYIGTPGKNITPLQWLTYLANGLSSLLPEQVQVFDSICSDLYALTKAVPIVRDDVF